jgi:hypothetical protein
MIRIILEDPLFEEFVGITAAVGPSRHYCLIDSITSTDPTDPYRKPFIPVSVLFYLYHLFHATTEHHVYSSC